MVVNLPDPMTGILNLSLPHASILGYCISVARQRGMPSLRLFNRFTKTNFSFFKLNQQRRDIVFDNTPKRIIVFSKITVNQPVASGNPLVPRNPYISITNIFSGCVCSLTYQFKITYGGILVQSVCCELTLVQPIGV